MKTTAYIVLGFFFTVNTGKVFCQQKPPPDVVAGIPVNYDESKVGTYILPDPLLMQHGQRVKNAAAWTKKRRPEIFKMFEEQQFGKVPEQPSDLSFHIFDQGTPVFKGKAVRKQITLFFTQDTSSSHKAELIIYLPAGQRKSPLLLNLSFSANSNLVDDPGVKRGMIWSKEGKRIPAPGQPFGKLDVEQFIDAGFGFASLCYTDIEPDMLEGITFGGIRSVYLKNGAKQPAADEWGAISAWSWGLSRVMDYLETDLAVDARRVALTGASRLGKTVLWTGARDTRFAMIIASISGEGGAALSRRNYGETIAHLTAPSRYPYQFAQNYAQYAQDVNNMPFDSHMLLSLIAPRPLLLQTGDADFWSDPKGEYLAAQAAEQVYKLFGKTGPGNHPMPSAGDTSVLFNPLGYYMHKGGHTVLPEDWSYFIDYMKKFL